MATPGLRPLDDALVAKLRNDIQNQGHLFTPVARAHWEAILNHFEGRSDFEIRAYIAQNFKSNHWIGNEAWFLDNYTQKVFQGYEPTEFVQSGIPALDDEARSHYNPSNTVRDYLLRPLRAKSRREWLPPCLAAVCSFTASICTDNFTLSPRSGAAICSLHCLWSNRARPFSTKRDSMRCRPPSASDIN